MNYKKRDHKIKVISNYIAVNYAALEFYIEDELEWQELRYVKSEIVDALLINNHQAAIVTTNHFLERALKFALIYNKTNGKKVTDVDSMQMYEQPVKEYGGLTLSKTIEACFNEKIISEETKEVLLKFKDILRNPYSHADPKTTFGGTRMKFAIGKFDKPGELKIGEGLVHNMPVMQGVAQVEHAKAHSIPYFRQVYSIVKDMIKNVESKK